MIFVFKQEPGDRLDAYEAVFTALAHPVRRRILLTVYFKGGTPADKPKKRREF